MKPILFIMSGLPGSGKSTLSQFLSKKYKIPYIRIDTIEQGLRDLCHIDVVAEGYELAYRIAAEQLRFGLHIVVDSCNPINLTRMAWENIAKSNHGVCINIEVICSDKDEHRHRIETRIMEIENLKPPTWEDIENRIFNPWESERIVIDTAHKSREESQNELDTKIHSFCSANGIKLCVNKC